jgi:hypothetical protein
MSKDRFAWKPGDVQVEPPEECTCGTLCGDDFESRVAVYTRVPAPDCPVHRGS